MANARNAQILRTIVLFSVVLIAALLASNFLLQLTGSRPKATTALITFVAATISGQRHAVGRGHAPAGFELWALLLGSFLICTVVTVASTLAPIYEAGGLDALGAKYGVRNLSMNAVLVGLGIVLASQLLALGIGYGPATRFLVRQTGRRGP